MRKALQLLAQFMAPRDKSCLGNLSLARQVLSSIRDQGGQFTSDDYKFENARKLTLGDNSTATFILRIVLGIVFFAHGAEELFGWFGGYGFAESMAPFTEALGLPPLLAYLAMVAELFGGLGLIFGLLSRVAALAIAVDMVVAIVMMHRHFGFL